MASVSELMQGYESEEVDPQIFPIGPDIIRSLFNSKSIPAQENDQGLYEWMRTTNPYAFDYLDNFDELLDDKKFHTDNREKVSSEISDSLMHGQLLFYATYRERSSKSPLIILTEDYIERYSAEKNLWLGVSHVNSLGDRDQAIFVHLFNMASFFKMAEADTYDAILEVLAANDSEKKYSAEYVIAGFAQAYFLFKEGLSNMENYETEHMIIQ